MNVKLNLESQPRARQRQWAAVGGCLLTFTFTGKIFSSELNYGLYTNTKDEHYPTVTVGGTAQQSI